MVKKFSFIYFSMLIFLLSSSCLLAENQDIPYVVLPGMPPDTVFPIRMQIFKTPDQDTYTNLKQYRVDFKIFIDESDSLYTNANCEYYLLSNLPGQTTTLESSIDTLVTLNSSHPEVTGYFILKPDPKGLGFHKPMYVLRKPVHKYAYKPGVTFYAHKWGDIFYDKVMLIDFKDPEQIYIGKSLHLPEFDRIEYLDLDTGCFEKVNPNETLIENFIRSLKRRNIPTVRSPHSRWIWSDVTKMVINSTPYYFPINGTNPNLESFNVTCFIGSNYDQQVPYSQVCAYQVYDHDVNDEDGPSPDFRFCSLGTPAKVIVDWYDDSHHYVKVIYIINNYSIYGTIQYQRPNIRTMYTQNIDSNEFVYPRGYAVLYYYSGSTISLHDISPLDGTGRYNFNDISCSEIGIAFYLSEESIWIEDYLDHTKSTGIEFFNPEINPDFWDRTDPNPVNWIPNPLNFVIYNIKAHDNGEVGVNLLYDYNSQAWSLNDADYCAGANVLEKSLKYIEEVQDITNNIFSECNLHILVNYQTQQASHVNLCNGTIQSDRITLGNIRNNTETGDFWNVSVLYHELSHCYIHWITSYHGQPGGEHDWNEFIAHDIGFNESIANYLMSKMRISCNFSDDISISDYSFENYYSLVKRQLLPNTQIVYGVDCYMNYSTGEQNPPVNNNDPTDSASNPGWTDTNDYNAFQDHGANHFIHDRTEWCREKDITTLIWDLTDSDESDDTPEITDNVCFTNEKLFNCISSVSVSGQNPIISTTINHLLQKLCINAPQPTIDNVTTLALNHNVIFSPIVPTIHNVNLNGGEEFRNINEALISEQLNDYDILEVYPGNYEDSLTINQPLTIISHTNNPDDVIISGLVTVRQSSCAEIKYITFETGGINASESSLILDGCVFQNIPGAALSFEEHLYNSSINNCIFKENQTAIGDFSGNFKREYHFNRIQNCQFFHNQLALSVTGTNVINCTIAENQTALENCGSNYTNCIIWGNDQLFSNSSSISYYNYCDVQEEVQGIGNVSINPHFTASEQNNFTLQWDNILDNPCVDTGNPDLDGDGLMWYDDVDDQDPDGTRMDMGAYPLIDGHVQGVHVMNRGQVEYISFPGLIRPELQNEENLLTHIHYVFDQYNENWFLAENPAPYLHVYSKTNDISLDITPQGDVPEHFICSQYGYKVWMSSLMEDDETLIHYKGYRPGTTNNLGMFVEGLTPYEITKELFIKNPNDAINCDTNFYSGAWQREIYLGYYLQESMDPFDALGPVLSNLVGIYAKDWSLVRVPVADGGLLHPEEPWLDFTNIWLGRVSNGQQPTINPGEMVVVEYIGNPDHTDVVFKWGGENPDQYFLDPVSRDMPRHFGYEEQPEYIPIFIQMDLDQYEDGNKPLEVAVFINNECKGAAVIKEDQVQLNAYICADSTDALASMEFQLWFPEKHKDLRVGSYLVMNENNGRYELRKATVSDCSNFLRVSLDASSPLVGPMVNSLIGNFPNPFNPDTIIKYDIAKKTDAKLEVYNTKGQLVKTLFNATREPGSYAAKWDGKNNNGRTVGTGVYFYRLSTDGKTLTKKMLLLK